MSKGSESLLEKPKDLPEKPNSLPERPKNLPRNQMKAQGGRQRYGRTVGQTYRISFHSTGFSPPVRGQCPKSEKINNN